MNTFFQRDKIRAESISRSGTTIIELIIYMGIFGTLLVVFTHFFLTVLDVKRESEAVSYTAQDARFLLQRLTYDIKNSSSITTPGSLGSQGALLVLVQNGSTVTYLASGSALLRNGERIHSFNTDVLSPSFTRRGNTNGKNALQISYTVTGKVRKSSGAQSTIIQTAVAIR